MVRGRVIGRGSGVREALRVSWITPLSRVEDTEPVRTPGMVAVAKHQGDPWEGENSRW